MTTTTATAAAARRRAHDLIEWQDRMPSELRTLLAATLDQQVTDAELSAAANAAGEDTTGYYGRVVSLLHSRCRTPLARASVAYRAARAGRPAPAPGPVGTITGATTRWTWSLEAGGEPLLPGPQFGVRLCSCGWSQPVAEDGSENDGAVRSHIDSHGPEARAAHPAGHHTHDGIRCLTGHYYQER